MKKLLLLILLLAGCSNNVASNENFGGTVLKVPNGGTGATTFTAGECLYGNGDGAIYSDSCAAGSMTALPEGNIYVGNASNTATATSSVTVSATGVLSASGGNSTDWTTAFGWGNHAGVYDVLGQATSTLASHTTIYNHANYDTAYSWGNHAGLYDIFGQATSTLASHTGTYNHANYDTAYSWGNHAGLYDILGQATSTLASHTTTYNHANYDTAYSWGNHVGLYDILGQATSTLASHLSAYNHDNFYNSYDDIPSASPTNGDTTHFPTADQVYDFIASNPFSYLTSVASDSDWTQHNSYPTGCTNQFVRSIGDTLTCATVDVSDDTNLTCTATGLEINGDAIAWSSGYDGLLTASSTNWNTFYNTPSSRIVAGTNISWSTNTLNVDDAFLLNNGDTATGDYAFDTDTLKIDATNNRVGVGTSTPGSVLSVGGVINLTSATSSVYSSGGINLTNGGCFAINGTCIGGGGASAPSYSFGTELVSNTSHTNNWAHGLGKTPTRVRITTLGTDATWETLMSHGVYDGTKQSVVYMKETVSQQSDSHCAYMDGGAGDLAGVCSFSSTNVTITWTETSNFPNEVQVLWEAWAY